MNKVAKAKWAFSLIEVVIAIAVVTVGIISILALFGVSFTAVRDVTNQREAYGVAQALPSYMQSVGFNNIYAGIQAGTANNIYAYTTNNCIVLDTNGSPAMSSASIANRSGRLFNISLSLSTNAPVVSSTNVTTIPAYAPALPGASTPDTGFGDAYLPVTVKIYSVSQVPALPSMTRSSPSLTYDTILSR